MLLRRQPAKVIQQISRAKEVRSFGKELHLPFIDYIKDFFSCFIDKQMKHSGNFSNFYNNHSDLSLENTSRFIRILILAPCRGPKFKDYAFANYGNSRRFGMRKIASWNESGKIIFLMRWRINSHQKIS